MMSDRQRTAAQLRQEIEQGEMALPSQPVQMLPAAMPPRTPPAAQQIVQAPWAPRALRTAAPYDPRSFDAGTAMRRSVSPCERRAQRRGLAQHVTAPGAEELSYPPPRLPMRGDVDQMELGHDVAHIPLRDAPPLQLIPVRQQPPAGQARPRHEHDAQRLFGAPTAYELARLGQGHETRQTPWP